MITSLSKYISGTIICIIIAYNISADCPPNETCIQKFMILQAGLETELLNDIAECVALWRATQNTALDCCQRIGLHRTLAFRIHRLKNTLPQEHQEKLRAIALNQYKKSEQDEQIERINPDATAVEFCSIFL
jgi:hypothetical protein